MKENKIWNDYLPEDMQEHWTVYECLKESEDSSTFLVKETVTGILCVLKWGRNRQAEFLRNEMEIMEKMADRTLSGIPKTYRIFEENGEVYLVREYIEGMSLAQMESMMIQRALVRHGASLEGKKQAAKELGISLSTLYEKLRKTAQAKL